MGKVPDNFHGKKGRSGRKSIYQEHADAVMLEQMFLQEMSKEEVQKKLASGKYSLKEVFVSKAFAGNERMLIAMFNKLFPEKTDITIGGRKSTDKLQDEELGRLMDVFEDKTKMDND